MVAGIACRFGLLRATDFADHHDGVSFWISFKELQDVLEAGSVDRIAADANAGRDADAKRLHLCCRFIPQGAGPPDDSDATGHVDMGRHDAHEALTGADDPGAVRADQAHLAFFGVAFQEALDLHHVLAGDAVGHANCGADACVGGLHDRVGGAGGGHEHQGRLGPSRLYRFTHGVEERAVKVAFAAPSGGNAAHDIRAVLDHVGGMKAADAASEALHDDRGLFGDQDGHCGAPYAAMRGRAATALAAASASVSAEISGRPESSMILRPSSTLVPASRTTTGSVSPNWR